MDLIRHTHDEQQVSLSPWKHPLTTLIHTCNTRNNRHRQGRSRERSPLWPQNSSSSYGAGSVPRTPGSQPPPPYEPLLPDTGDWQGTSYRRCRDPSPFRIPAITTGRIAAFIIFLIVLAQAVAFVFFYDLPYKLDEYSKAVSRMRQERGVMRREERRLEGERTALQRESNRLEKERKDWEKAREDRIPQGAFWETVWPAPDCRAYGEREYWAALQNIPEDWADLDACMNTPVKIKGVTVRRPDRCGYVGGSSSIHGFWMVDWDQLDCKPWHIYVTDQVSAEITLAIARRHS